MAINISTIIINASKQKVWDTITKAELVNFGNMVATCWQLGKSATCLWNRMEDKVFEQWGKVLEFRPTEILKYSLFALRPDS